MRDVRRREAVLVGRGEGRESIVGRIDFLAGVWGSVLIPMVSSIDLAGVDLIGPREPRPKVPTAPRGFTFFRELEEGESTEKVKAEADIGAARLMG